AIGVGTEDELRAGFVGKIEADESPRATLIDAIEPPGEGEAHAFEERDRRGEVGPVDGNTIQPFKPQSPNLLFASSTKASMIWSCFAAKADSATDAIRSEER